MDILIRSAKAIGSVVGARRAAKWVRSHQGHRLESALSRFGVVRKTSAWPTVGLVGLSALVGVGVALVLAPSSGAELRSRLQERLDEAKRKRFPNAAPARLS
jgi:hypothetical protein